MKREIRTCRHRTAGKLCRRSPRHAAHQAHGADCSVPVELHHVFVAARPYGSAPGARKKRQDSDPFVRTSMLMRRSDLTYLTATYGSAVGKLREWIAADRGIGGARLMRHLGGKFTTSARGIGGKFVPKAAAANEDQTALIGEFIFPLEPVVPVEPTAFEIPSGEIPAAVGLVSNWIEPVDPPSPPDDDEDLVL